MSDKKVEPKEWLLLVHQLPAKPSRARVTTWRRLQKLGAIPIRGAVWALPNSPQALEDFTWVKGEIAAFGGEATMYAASAVGQARTASAGKPGRLAPLARRRFRRRVWVTRPRPGIDRMASAWLIRRFIDPDARFAFADAPPPARSKAVPFDMFGGELSHQGELCTYEVLARRFGVDDRAALLVGQIVHDIDLRDERYKHPQTATIEALVDGLRAGHPVDAELLTVGMTLIEGLYHTAKRAAR